MTRVLLAALLIASGARAGEPEPSDRSAPAIPSNGVDESPRRGTFAEASLGVFATLGGSRALSNAQPWLGFTFGRDLGSSASLFASIGAGASSASCYQIAPSGSCAASDSFSAAFLEAGVAYGTWMARRLLLSGKLLGGATLFSPSPFTKNAAVPDRAIGPHVGAGLGLDYDTRLSHFGVGLDAVARYSLAPTDGGGRSGIASLALMPRIRYVF
ncbi:MAG TPA: adventurous gliding motility protein CglE [Myxococcales bacterium]|nr:adventurous gliding motility protein CglE [Myxococcales bacterium]